MKLKIIAVATMLAICAPAFAQTYVKGHYRKNGTYVQPHVRSNPNATKADNYGPSPRARSSSSYAPSTYSSPYTRDKDQDGISNMYDNDDDNDGIWDDDEN